MQDARDEFRQKMNQILTPEQQKKMAGMGMGPGMGAGMGPGARMGDRGEALLNQLNLTDAQKEQIKPLREKMQADLKQIRDNNSLSPEQKREQAQTVTQQNMDDIKKILTPEQKAKLDELQKNRPQRGPAAFRGRHSGTAADSNSK
jgi:Spy/CpxP family protein refolding chaperone